MDISTEVAAIQAASEGNQLREPLVGALNKLNSGVLPVVTAQDVGKILKVGANGWEVGEKSGYIPVPIATMQITENDTYDVTNYANAIVNIPPSGAILVSKTINQNGTYDPTDDNADGYNEVIVNVSSGSSGVYVGTSDPDNNVGANGDYYYKRHKLDYDGINHFSGGSSGTTFSGYRFYLNEDTLVNGLSYYSTASNVSNISVWLFKESDSSVIASIESPDNDGSGWKKLYLNTPVTLTANTNYIVAVKSPNDGLRYQNKSSATSYNALTIVSGMYGYSNQSIPSTIDNSNIYSADILIDNSSGIYVVSDQFYKSNNLWNRITT